MLSLFDNIKYNLKLNEKQNVIMTVIQLLFKIIVVAHLCGSSFVFITRYE